MYLDSLDLVRVMDTALAEALENTESAQHARFVACCKHFGLPLNDGKRLIGSFQATLQGGEFLGRYFFCSWKKV